MLDALTQIRTDLEQEARSRTRRSLVLFFALALVAMIIPVYQGTRLELLPQELVALAIAAGFVLLGVSMSASPKVRVGTGASVLLAAIAFLSPLVGATSLGARAVGWGCFLMIAVLGLSALVAARLILGRARRRFGGATRLQAVACAMAAALGVGLECPASDAVHLLIHAAAAVLVGVGLSRALLR